MSNKWIKIDPHVHSSGVSACSHVTCAEIIDEKMRLGYDGAVLTNHCQCWYYPIQEHPSFMEKMIAEYRQGKAYADEKGFRLYLGIEVSLQEPHYADWLLYGVTEEFLRASPCLYALSQKELFQYCEKWGVVMVQAHPYRQAPCNPEYMHGVEINCNECDLDKVALVEQFAQEHDLLVICGTDYHSVNRTFLGGIFVPEECENAAELAKWMRAEGAVKVFFGKKETVYKSSVFKK